MVGLSIAGGGGGALCFSVCDSSSLVVHCIRAYVVSLRVAASCAWACVLCVAQAFRNNATGVCSFVAFLAMSMHVCCVLGLACRPLVFRGADSKSGGLRALTALPGQTLGIPALCCVCLPTGLGRV